LTLYLIDVKFSTHVFLLKIRHLNRETKYMWMGW